MSGLAIRQLDRVAVGILAVAEAEDVALVDLAEVGAAGHQRLAQGRYTTCSVCGGDIEAERLAAVPYTDRCRACAEGGRPLPGRGRPGG